MNIQPGKRSSQKRASSRAPPALKISTTENGAPASVIPATTPPKKRCRTNQSAVRHRAGHARAGPVASSSGRAVEHRARAAAPSNPRTVGTSAVTAAIGSEVNSDRTCSRA